MFRVLTEFPDQCLGPRVQQGPQKGGETGECLQDLPNPKLTIRPTKHTKSLNEPYYTHSNSAFHKLTIMA